MLLAQRLLMGREELISELINAGGLYADGLVSERARLGIAFNPNSNKFVVAYRGTSGYASAVVGRVAGNSITFGTPVVIDSSLTRSYALTAVYDSSNDKFIIGYAMNVYDDYNVVVGTVSGLSISFGTKATATTYESIKATMCFDENSNKAVVFVSGRDGHWASPLTVSGTSISFGSINRYEITTSSYSDGLDSVYDPSTNQIILSYSYANNSTLRARVRTATVSGTSVSLGPVLKINGSDENLFRCAALSYDSANNQPVLAYSFTDNDTTLTDTNLNVVPLNVSGTSITKGSVVIATDYTSFSDAKIDLSYKPINGKHLISYSNGNDTMLYYRFCSLDSGVITIEDEQSVDLGFTPDVGIDSVLDTSTNKAIVASIGPAATYNINIYLI